MKENIYVIDTVSYSMINYYVNKILKDNNLSDDALIKYDLLEVSINDVVNDLDTYGLFVSRKLIVCYNAYFLTSVKEKVNVSHDLDLFLKYVNNPSSNILVLVCDGLVKNKVAKAILKNGVYINKELSIEDMIKSSLDGYKMDFKTIKYLINYCDNSVERVLNEVNKLKSYVYPREDITIDDINEAVMKINDADIFKFIDDVVLKKRSYALKEFEKLIDSGEDVNKLLVMVADYYHLIVLCMNYLKLGISNDEIAKKLMVHPYKVKLAIDKSYQYTQSEIFKKLDELANIDLLIKSGRGSGVNNFISFLNNL